MAPEPLACTFGASLQVRPPFVADAVSGCLGLDQFADGPKMAPDLDPGARQPGQQDSRVLLSPPVTCVCQPEPVAFRPATPCDREAILRRIPFWSLTIRSRYEALLPPRAVVSGLPPGTYGDERASGSPVDLAVIPWRAFVVPKARCSSPKELRMELILNKRDAAERLGVSHRTVTRLIESGQIKAFRVGAQVRIRGVDLDRFISDRLKAGV